MNATCPPADMLRDYARGLLPQEQFDTVDQHLDTCATCQSTLADLQAEPDELVAVLQHEPAAAEVPEGTAYRLARELVQGISREWTQGPEPAADKEFGRLPQQLRDYQLLDPLGRGGMGTVYRAIHTRLKKQVAVKVLPEDRMNRPEAVERFQREMEAIGRLEHPHLVRATDAGEVDGIHFLVMELVEGVSLTELVDRCGPLPVADACELVRQAAMGLQYVHEHGLVHRDIKPSNIMLSVSSQPSPGESVRGAGREGVTSARPPAAVKILDLGLALLRNDAPGRELTSSGQLMGTVDYMAPEQARDTHRVDIRADIYSLGCTLYKLLTGRVPFGPPNYKTYFEKLTAHTKDAPPPINELRPEVPPELAALVGRLMAKEPADRPATPGEVATALAPFCGRCDLGRLLNAASGVTGLGTVEMACSASTGKLSGSAQINTDITQTSAVARPQAVPVRTWPSRSFAVSLAAVAGVFLLIAFGVIVIRIRDKQGRETVIEVPAGSKVTIEERTPTQGEQAAARSDRPRQGTAQTKTEPKLATARTNDQIASATKTPPLSLAALVPRPTPLPGVKSWSLETMYHRGAVYAVKYSPDGRRLASAGDDGSIRLWNMESNTLERILMGHDHLIGDLEWSRDGCHLASCSFDGTVRIWAPNAGQVMKTIDCGKAEPWDLARSHDGETLACGAWDGTLMFIDPQGNVKKLGDGIVGRPSNNRLCWAPDDQTIVQPAGYRAIDLLPVHSPAMRKTIQVPHDPNGVTWSPSQNRFAVWPIVRGNSVMLLQWADGTASPVQSLDHQEAVSCVAIAPDGKWLVSVGMYGSIRVWDGVTGEPRGKGSILHPRRNPWIYSVDFSPDGESFACGAEWGNVQVFEVDTLRVRSLLGTPEHLGFADVSWSPDGQYLASCHFAQDDKLRVWDRMNGRLVSSTNAGYRSVQSIAWHPSKGEISVFRPEDEKAIGTVTVSSDGALAIEGPAFTKLDAAPRLTWSKNGDLLAGAGYPYGVRVIEPQKARTTSPTADHVMSLQTAPAWSPNGPCVAWGSDAKVRFWDLARNLALPTLEGPRGMLHAVAWSPDGRLLASAGEHPDILIWDVAARSLFDRIQTRFAGTQASAVASLAWLGDGKRLMLVTRDARMQTYNCETGTVERDSRGPAPGELSVDARWLVSVEERGTGTQLRGPFNTVMRVWNVATAEPGVTILLQQDNGWLAIAPDGHHQGSRAVAKHLRYVVEADDGQATLTPDEFAARYGWENDLADVSAAPPLPPPAPPKTTP